MIGQDKVREGDTGTSQQREDAAAYEPPRLDVLGSVEELTAGGQSGTFDDFGFTPLS